MSTIPLCPRCGSDLCYPDNNHYICPECTFEWHISDDHTTSDEESLIVKDAYGNILQDGDAVILIKDLKVKGSSLVIKKGTKVKNIRCIEGDHNIDCKIDGTSLQLKSEFLKKA